MRSIFWAVTKILPPAVRAEPLSKKSPCTVTCSLPLAEISEGATVVAPSVLECEEPKAPHRKLLPLVDCTQLLFWPATTAALPLSDRRLMSPWALMMVAVPKRSLVLASAWTQPPALMVVTTSVTLSAAVEELEQLRPQRMQLLCEE